MKVYINNNLRKEEFAKKDDEFAKLTLEAFKTYKPDCEVCGVSTNGEGLYGLYMSEKPNNSPIDLSDVVLDPECNNILSFKLEGQSIRVKTYRIGNTSTFDIGKEVAVTGEYLGEQITTLYYPSDGVMPKHGSVFTELSDKGFSSTTFYADGTSSSEIGRAHV